MIEVGDVVVCINDTNQYTKWFYIGAKYTVKGVSRTGQFISLGVNKHWVSCLYFEKLSEQRRKKIESIYE